MRSPRNSLLIFLLALAVTVALGGYLLFHDRVPPEITLSPQIRVISPGQKFVVTLTDDKSPIRSVTVSVRKNSQKLLVASHTFTDKAQKQAFEFRMDDINLRDGTFVMAINAVDRSWAGFGLGNSATREFPLVWETTPPRITYKTTTPHLQRGGSGCIVYKVSREIEKTGVAVQDYFFPAYKLANGDYICFFAFPYTIMAQDYAPELSVTDYAGNVHTSRLPITRSPRPFKEDTIRISDNFLAAKMPDFESSIPGTASQLELFNKVNGELRRANAAKLMELGQKTGLSASWNDAFMPLPKSAVKAGFGEQRTYLYNNEKLPVQATHLGLDLASVARAPIPAGNAGTVIFTGPLGIYGNLVVIDHGFGLQSLYSHLSDIRVTEGQNVTRGQIIGTTGTTGMAVGDHVHFGILVSGLEVAPIEWLDRNWIRNNITDRLKTAGTPGVPVLNNAAQKADEASLVESARRITSREKGEIPRKKRR